VAPAHGVVVGSENAIGEVTMVAAHAWDVAGALAAGCRAGFVARQGMPRNPIDPEPDVIGAHLGEIADRILAAHDNPVGWGH
jgi:2-haloacid dehalogenase